MPYEREKNPLPKRQLRQSTSTLTANQPFHDILNSSNAARTAASLVSPSAAGSHHVTSV